MNHTKANLSAALCISVFGVLPTSCPSARGEPIVSKQSVGSDAAVIVGSRNKILFSTDGITWLTQTAPAEASLRAVAFGAGTFVAVGNEGVILTSTNGCILFPADELDGSVSDGAVRDDVAAAVTAFRGGDVGEGSYQAAAEEPEQAAEH
jgi:hypothetical protein